MICLRTRTLLAAALLTMTGMAAAHDATYDAYRDGHRYGDTRGDWRAPSPRRFRCESQDARTAYCRVDTRDGVRLVDRLSRASCIPGRTWGWDRGGVWVSDGCRAEFVAGGDYRGERGDRWRDDDDRDDRYRRDDDGYGDRYGGRGNYGGYDGYGRDAVRYLTCESSGGDYNFCRGGRGIRQVQVHRQLSNAACRYNESWGFRGDGIWVDRGCRAEFALY